MTRKEAINELRELWYRWKTRSVSEGEAINMAIKALEQEPKTGHWVDHQEGRWIYAKCSECETVHDTQTNYCPNCGARMESEGAE